MPPRSPLTARPPPQLKEEHKRIWEEANEAADKIKNGDDDNKKLRDQLREAEQRHESAEEANSDMKKKLGARPPSPRPQDLRTNATALPAESLEAQIKSLESSLEKTATENTELEERSNQLSKDKTELTDNLETEKQKRSELQSGASSFAMAIPPVERRSRLSRSRAPVP